MSSIGRYNLLVSETGQYAVEWMDNNRRQLVMLPDLVDQINQMVEKEISTRKHFASIFNLIFGEKCRNFEQHPDSAILQYLDDDDKLIPNKKLGKEELFTFNINCLLSAYNRWQGTRLQYREVRGLCDKKLM